MAQAQTEYPLAGNDKIYDYKTKVENMNLWNGRMEMNGFETLIMIRKGSEIKKSCYDMMNTFQHNSCIRHLGFFIDDASRLGRLAIPSVGAYFGHWIRENGPLLIYNGNMTRLFTTMILDLCDVVKKLHDEKGIMIKNLQYRNLYLADEYSDGHFVPRILLLVTEAEYKQATNNIQLFAPIQEVIQWCYRECHATQNEAATRFCSFLVSPLCSMINLKNYPLDWNHRIKGEYLVSALAKHRAKISNSMNKIGDWPRENGDMPYVLKMIVENKKDSSYVVTRKFDYVILIRDAFKHFHKFPKPLKESLGSREAFIAMVDTWSQDIWMNLYDIIGWC